MTEVTYIDAIREAQHDLLEQDERVFIYGQDVGRFGGAFKATQGLRDKFPTRVIDSPISEDAMIGMAIGAALEGMRPLVEIQFADFSSIAFNQIVNPPGSTSATPTWRRTSTGPEFRFRSRCVFRPAGHPGRGRSTAR